MAISHPLCEWRLGGFRSIRDETRFELGGLNVLVGANSAGKSSVLQSMLLTAQTLGNPLSERPLMLNGPLVRLGLADDTVHEGGDGVVRVGFGLYPQAGGTGGVSFDELDRLDVRAEFVPSSSGADFELISTTVRAVPNESLGEPLVVEVQRRTEPQAREALQAQGLSRERARMAAKETLYAVSGTVPPGTAGASVRQFLPEGLHVVANEYEQALQELVMRRHFRTASGRLIRASGRSARMPVPRSVRRIIRAFLEDLHGSEVSRLIPVSGDLTVERMFDALPVEAQEAVRQLPLDPWLDEHRETLPFRGTVDHQELPPAVDNGLTGARRWFQARVRHLGPLRAAPQPLYGLPEAASGTSVGRNGEYTAAVLSAHANRLVPCPEPKSGEVAMVSLGEAVDHWMTALGLLSSVRSQERGKLGYELHLAMDGIARDLDLTSVGVGVSQALPIVVLGLISPPGALLLFEQPELHLHPDVQASLGDFFLALANSGRQLIVETHSEYLVNRLRRRAATDSEHGVEDIVRLFFFERQKGTARVRSGRIHAGGAVPDWPRGFLDTAAREVEAIAAAFRGASAARRS